MAPLSWVSVGPGVNSLLCIVPLLKSLRIPVEAPGGYHADPLAATGIRCIRLAGRTRWPILGRADRIAGPLSEEGA